MAGHQSRSRKNSKEEPREHKSSQAELRLVKARLADAEETLSAIRSGQIDAIVVDGARGQELVPLPGADNAYRVFVEGMSEGAVTVNLDGTILFCNRAFAELMGTDPEVLVGSSFLDLVKPEQFALFEGMLRNAERGPSKAELLLCCKDARSIPVFMSLCSFPGENSRTMCMVVTDLTEQKRQEEIVAAGRLARVILEQAVEAIAVCDSQGRVVLASHALHELCGRNPLFQHFDSAVPLTYGDSELSGSELSGRFSIASVLKGNRFRAVEMAFRKPNGELVHLLLSAGPITLPGEESSGCVITLFDIEERRRVEGALRRSEKLAATGRLAATIAHEINNPLESLTNLMFLLSSSSRVPEPEARYITMAESELSRVAHITRQTLTFHRDSNTPVPVNLAEMLDSLVYLYARKAAEKMVRVEKRFEGTPSIIGFPNELRQVFVNVLENALEASPARGRLLVRLHRSAEWNNSHKPGVRVVIADQGPGISEAVRARVFEPFFTTKGERGSGLGLWVSNGIVHKHGGFIRVRSRAGAAQTGTAISVFLPCEFQQHSGAGAGALT